MDMLPTLCSVAKRLAFVHFGTRLDLTVRSVRGVEKILRSIHKEQLNARSDNGFDGVALEFAAYIVDVIQRNFGPAQWQRDCPTEGRDAFPLYWRDSVIYPYEWCRGRIYGGADQDVWVTFQTVVLGKPPRPWWKPFGKIPVRPIRDAGTFPQLADDDRDEASPERRADDRSRTGTR